MIRPRRRPPGWVWVVLVVISLGFGAGAGLFVGFRQSNPDSGPATEAESTAETDAARQEKVARTIGEARAAVAEGEWFEARQLFEKVRQMDPDNPDALASLPLIDRRLDEARGAIEVQTAPPGATVEVRGFEQQKTPATIEDVPLGEHEVVVSLDGYETVSRRVEVTGEDTVTVPPIELSPTSGQLEVVSEPRGADFRLIRTLDGEQKKLVEIGKTPALIESLDPGEYEVHMAVEGWPEYNESVRVRNDRNASVSAVFAKGGLRITSDPPGAEVFLVKKEEDLDKVGRTPLNLTGLPVGQHRIELRYRDWKPIRRTVDVADGVTRDLAFSWERALVAFDSDPPGAEVFAGEDRLGNGREVTPFRVELPEGEYRFTARHEKLGNESATHFVDADSGTNAVDFSFDYGSVTLTSDPAGAAVISGGVPLGRTPLELSVVPPGSYTYEITKDQYRSTEVSGTVEPGGSLDFTTSLKFDPAPVASRNFRNGLGQQLVWFGELNGWVAAHETTQEEFERVMGINPSHFEAPDHPVDSVTWYQAVRYCEALTVQERGLGNLPEGYRYRLPTDSEWSKLVGGQKLDGAITSMFQQRKSTAPVGSLMPNDYGLYDLRGNVWEWVENWYSPTILNRVRSEGASPHPDWVGTDRKVLRGGAWNRSSRYDLSVANRMAARPSAEDRYDVGFRVVLMRD